MSLGRSALLVKLDLSNAYRIIPVHPYDQPLLGVTWWDNTYLDRSLSFGLRSAPKIFNSMADFLAWCLFYNHVPWVIHYLDDFLIIGPAGSALASSMRPQAESLLDYVGAPVASHKTEGPLTALTFLGIHMDTVSFQLSLPKDKLLRLRELLSHWRHCRSCTKKDLQRFLGHLSHAATVIRPGRIFLYNLFSLLSRLSAPNHYTRLNLDTRADIAWWQCLLQHWNGCSFFPPAAPSCQVSSDASGSFRCGAYSADLGLWFQLSWPQSWSSNSIAAKELVPIVISAALWGPHWSGKHVRFHCDNEAVVTVIENRVARNDTLIDLQTLRQLSIRRLAIRLQTKH